MIRKLFNQPHDQKAIIHQETDGCTEIEVTAGRGVIFLLEGGECIAVEYSKVPELCKLLKQLAAGK